MNELGGGGIVTANKIHSCAWCQSPIRKGEKHYQFKGKWMGDWQNWRMHSECADAHGQETQDGEIHSHAHQRGRTCSQTEMARWQKVQEIGRLVRTMIEGNRLKSDRELEDLGAEILDLVVEWTQEERKRVLALETVSMGKAIA